MKNDILDKKLVINEEKCIHCGLCEKTCWNGALKLTGENRTPTMVITEITDEWHLCWECQRCLAVCPTGALSICGKDPADSLPREMIPSPESVEALIANRRSCRSFQQKNVDKDLIYDILFTCGNSPTGSCNQIMEFTVIDDIDVMKEFTSLLQKEMFEKLEEGIHPPRFDFDDMAMIKSRYDAGEEFCFRGAPHLLVAHAPIGKGEWVFDTGIALGYAELLMETNGLGFIYVSTPWAALQICPKTRAFLQIPDNHYISCPVGFGWPAYHFKRGVQRQDVFKINRLTSAEGKEVLYKPMREAKVSRQK